MLEILNLDLGSLLLHDNLIVLSHSQILLQITLWRNLDSFHLVQHVRNCRYLDLFVKGFKK